MICENTALRDFEQFLETWKTPGFTRKLEVKRTVFVPQTLLRKCQCCKEGNLITIALFGKRGPPQDFLFVTQNLSAK
ncbi:MAG: hypothetical protein WBY99_12605 [Kaistella sp.]